MPLKFEKIKLGKHNCLSCDHCSKVMFTAYEIGTSDGTIDICHKCIKLLPKLITNFLIQLTLKKEVANENGGLTNDRG